MASTISLETALSFFNSDYGRKALIELMPGGSLEHMDPQDAAKGILSQSIEDQKVFNQLTQDDFDLFADIIQKNRDKAISAGTNPAKTPEEALKDKYALKDKEAALLKNALKLDPRAMAINAALAGGAEAAGILGDVGASKHYNLANALISANPGMSKQLPSAIAARAATAASAEKFRGDRSARVGKGVSNFLNALRGDFNIGSNEIRARIGQNYSPISGGGYDYLRSIDRYGRGVN